MSDTIWCHTETLEQAWDDTLVPIPGLEHLSSEADAAVRGVVLTYLHLDPNDAMRQVLSYDGTTRRDCYYRSVSILDVVSLITLGTLETRRRWMREVPTAAGIPRVVQEGQDEHRLMVAPSWAVSMAIKSAGIHSSLIRMGGGTGKFQRILGTEREKLHPVVQEALLQPVMLEIRLLPGQNASTIVYHQQTSISAINADNPTWRCVGELQGYGLDLTPFRSYDARNLASVGDY